MKTTPVIVPKQGRMKERRSCIFVHKKYLRKSREDSKVVAESEIMAQSQHYTVPVIMDM